jgi:aryl-alcohol dehydrogenase-like predicted oxidoreductase
VCAREGLACVPYFALARGFLTGKYRPDGERVASVRAEGVEASYLNPRGLAVLAALGGVAAEHAVAPAAVALAWLRCKPNVVAPIASATSVAHEDLLASAGLVLSAEQVARLDDAGA